MRVHRVVRVSTVIALAAGMSSAGLFVAYKTASGMTSRRNSSQVERGAEKPTGLESKSDSSDRRPKHNDNDITWRNDGSDDENGRRSGFRDIFNHDHFISKLKHTLAKYKFKKHHKRKKHCKVVSPSDPFPPGPPFDPPGPPFDPPGPPFDPPGPPFDPPGPPFDPPGPPFGHHDHGHHQGPHHH